MITYFWGGLNRRLQSDNVDGLGAHAILEGVKLAIEKGWRQIEVESDARVVIEKINGKMEKWRLEVVCDNINILASRNNNFKWKAIPCSTIEKVNWISKKAKLGVCLDNCVMQPHPNLGICSILTVIMNR